MAKIIEFYIPQSFRKVSKWFPPSRTGQGAGIFSGGTKIGLTGAETGGETEIEQGEAMTEQSGDLRSSGGTSC